MSIRSFVGTAVVAALVAGCASTVSPVFNNADASRGSDAVAVDVAERVDVIASCRLANGNECALGQTCPAGDGCNHCTCSAGGLACTTLVCAPTTCRSPSDCPVGQSCEGPPGCDVTWSCVPGHSCPAIEAIWCDCAGHTFSTPSACPERPYQHTGACEMTPPPPDAGSCTANGSTCMRGTECCSGLCVEMGGIAGTCQAAPPETIGCGSTVCRLGTEYCEITYSDVPTPDSIRCRPLDDSCGGHPTCACLHDSGCVPCREQGVDTIVRQCPGG